MRTRLGYRVTCAVPSDRPTGISCYGYTLFTDSELAHVGLHEDEAKHQGVPYRLAKLPMAAVLRTRTLGEIEGFLKALISPDDRILGFKALGVGAGSVPTN